MTSFASLTTPSDGPRRSLLLGVVHLEPLPGSPGYAGRSIAPIVDAARRDADRLIEAGFDGFVVENFGDVPFFRGPVPPAVLTVMTRVAFELRREGVLVGANVLRNDARGALAVAVGAGLDFVRVNVLIGAAVTDQGIIQGQAAEVMRERATLAPGVAVLADVAVKHAVPLGAGFDLTEAARETAYRGLADGLIVTGAATGAAADPDHVRRVAEAVPDRPVLVGSGVTEDTVAGLLAHAGGVIVGTATKKGGDVRAPVDPARARALVLAARGA